VKSRARTVMKAAMIRQALETYTPDGAPLKTYFWPFLVLS